MCHIYGDKAEKVDVVQKFYSVPVDRARERERWKQEWNIKSNVPLSVTTGFIFTDMFI